TASGGQALLSNTSGSNNTGNGFQALVSNTTGNNNTANGAVALFSNTTGNGNTATGDAALFSNTTGPNNTATGFNALSSNTTGNGNTASGNQALLSNTTASGNTATGNSALSSNTTGSDNTAIGSGALSSNTLNAGNTAIGGGALSSNTGGDGNTALGFNAGDGVITASGVLCIGSGVFGADVSETTWIGNVYGVTTQNGTAAPVIVSADGQLGTMPSSERFKKDIATMEKASETILSLRPVTFHYKTDTKDTPQFGLIAEEVAKVNPALVLPDKDGKPYTVRYDQVNAMLLNEFLKEHRKVEDLEANTAHQQKQIEALTAGLQKVSARLEASKSAPQLVNNP
ncbi:MAG: tail fiber domain-containing protein, partial [Candidatus Udaeobacter sp.]